MIPLQKNIIYGPVNSRRLGLSLGLNVLPAKVKICSFDCQYCQYGWTGGYDDTVVDKLLPSKDEILGALEVNLKNKRVKPHYITFSGNGEAMLHPHFPELVDGVNLLRDKYSPGSKTAILSNSTMVHLPEIRQALSKLDMRIMKLDAGNEEVYMNYNRPVIKFKFDRIIEGLTLMDDVTIQALFTSGPEGNYTEDNIKSWIAKLKLIKPAFVQLYSLDRGWPSENITYVSKQDLLRVKSMIEKEGFKSAVY
jgi:wyosine [tRNA(Phe)-imidazoG37] synthetase (radical SAM superfamily)